MQRAAFSCPLSQAIPSKAHSFLLLPTPPLRSTNPLIIIGSLQRTCQPTFFSLTSTSYVLLKPLLLPQPAHLSSTASALVFLCQSACPHTTRAFAFPRQHDRLPQPGRSASSASTFGFSCQNVRLPLPTRLSPPASTFSSSCQNPQNPQPTESYSQPIGSPASTHAARAAR